MPELLILPIELRRFFEEPRNAVVLPAMVVVPLLSLWPYFASPLVPALCAAFACIEPHALNMWSLWPRQVEGFAVKPLDWKRAIAVKNAGTMILLIILFTAFAVIISFFHTGRIPAGEFVHGFLHALIGGLGLIIVGNNYSIVSPRGEIGWTLNDIGASVLAVVIGGISIVPALVAALFTKGLASSAMILVLYAILWRTWSLPNTALRLSTSIPELWMNTQS